MALAITETEFDGLFRSFRETAFRLETRDMYALSYEEADYRRFLAGSPSPPPDISWWRPWLDQIADLTKQGKRISRVRILAEPPSDYQRWELWAAPWHAAAGEHIRYMQRNTAARMGLPTGCDWWLFDDERLVIMRFDEAGRIDGKVLVTDPPVIAQHREWRDLAVRNAVPADEIAAA
jgi:Family of unknown function (DUF6879)